MTSTPFLDAANPPPSNVAKEWKNKYSVHSWGCYVGGPFVDTEQSWTQPLMNEYRDAGLKLLPIYVGQQQGLPNQEVRGVFTEQQANDDAVNALELLRKHGFHKGFMVLDVEAETVDSEPNVRVYIKRFFDVMNNHGYWPGCYGPPSVGIMCEQTHCAFLWIANWTQPSLLNSAIQADNAPGLEPNLWHKKRIWQYATGSLDGYGVDFSACNFDIHPNFLEDIKSKL